MAFAALGDSKRAWELFSLINPVRHGSSASAMAVYKVEPYVVAADVYAVSPHIGRGGWTWYTGSAGGRIASYSNRCWGCGCTSTSYISRRACPMNGTGSSYAIGTAGPCIKLR
jgi:hypothetical protein